MFTKCKELSDRSPTGSNENIADLLYEIGKSLYTKQDYQIAVKWLERAYDVLGQQDIDALSCGASELRLSIMHNIGEFASTKNDRL